MAKRKSFNKKHISVIIIAIIMCCISAVMTVTEQWDKLADDTVKSDNITDNTVLDAYFIDVGQGDCTLFISGDDTMLIDSGENEYGNTVVEHLNNLGISELDYVVATHAHSDHIGSMAYVINNLNVKNIIMSEPSDSAMSKKFYGEFLDAADASGAGIIIAEPDYSFSLGNAECRILSPYEVSEDENNNSVVMHITAGTTSFLMTGDAENQIEKELIKKYPDLSATILKTGHHGSTTSSCDAFIKQIMPQTAIIPVGENNYGHPTDKVLSTFEKYSVSYLRTDIEGTIHISCSENSYNITSDR